MSGTKYASKLTIGGETYVLKDKEARDAIVELQTGLGARISDLENASSSTVTTNDAVYKYAEDLYNEKHDAENLASAMAKFSIDTDPDNNSDVYADEVASRVFSAIVQLKYNGVAVEANTPLPSNWSETENAGEYKCEKSQTGPGTVTIPSTSFSYTTSDYKDPISKSSDAVSAKIIAPVYYGWVTSKDVPATITGFTRRTTNMSQTNGTGSFTNTLQSAAYLCILTKSTASVTQNGTGILDAAVPNKSFYYPDKAVQLTGYNAYFSTNSAEAGSGFGKLNITINI